MSPQLTLQAPLALSPNEVSGYLDRLWEKDLEASTGASTFTLVVWEPSWLQQQLIRTGHIDGPISGLLNEDLFDAARTATAECGLPLCTAPMAPELAWALGQQPGSHTAEDLRGQFVDQAISAHRPRRLITLAPTLREDHPLETLVAAYCPLPEERSGSAPACGDVVVLRGGKGAIEQGLAMLNPLVADDLPCWVWWNGSLDESPDLLAALALPSRRLVLDSSIGDPRRCLDVLVERIASDQAVNDLNWLRQRSWTESLAMVFDPPGRRDALTHVVQLDIDVEGDHPVQGLLLAAWIADRLGWHLQNSYRIPANGTEAGIGAEFQRSDGQIVQFRLMSVPVGVPKSHPGALVGLRLICCPEGRKPLCVILCSESGGCMRLEAGGVATMELAEEVVSISNESEEMEMARLLAGGHDTTSPLLAAAAPMAARLLPH
ncbi:glucose-6-phosphate dehydrogenase assembly protein OpcA [Synechococcus sp. CS-1325]|uniref:glucose-6-phosphate dehydrogenase assembly protein OpcA n=1 Tax=unclassified Synechococcus TaxID=2626047 RepID=UPI000DB1E94D|nr:MULTISPECIES: glucose-6-phosphate dehydrogenase assembly protein OpcA [unclassified Synechococcus]PZU98537.1 MAG: glucose 6-phosphate dehydrogenase [Cyanobium sp.]MCT0199090.1 glucose-6-phosphate dehydrogenase assembly protein OpcA [Synechococcus sp. CS-1325]MCT0212556.1 glucose-6-phosphate dehydrogenase assembly protein OpcA [Synechococcus sp. CS-1326]MCT0229937.1 glucose-6-phosphate dehydrogenase assembly protein OpcA [Synechococcus sp. CS-1324]MCT0232072.1 glucose-6-phosphate dehydrogena